MVLKDLKKMSISAKTMSWTVASLFTAVLGVASLFTAVLGVAADCCTGYMIQVNIFSHNALQRQCNTGTSL